MPDNPRDTAVCDACQYPGTAEDPLLWDEPQRAYFHEPCVDFYSRQGVILPDPADLKEA